MQQFISYQYIQDIEIFMVNDVDDERYTKFFIMYQMMQDVLILMLYQIMQNISSFSEYQ